MLKKLIQLKDRYKQLKSEETIPQSLNEILNEIPAQKPIEEQLVWSVQLLKWIRRGDSRKDSPLFRLEFLLKLLMRYPQQKHAVAQTLRSVFNKVSGVALYSETGLPKEWGIWSEVGDRILYKILPTPPLEHDLGYLIGALFPDDEDSLWLADLDSDLFRKIIELIFYEATREERDSWRFRKDIIDAFCYLVIQIRALGLSPGLRARMNNPALTESGFYKLGPHSDEFLRALNGTQSHDDNQASSSLQRNSEELKKTLQKCFMELQEIHSHLDEFGVNTRLVFQMMKIDRYLRRLESILALLSSKQIDAKGFTSFLQQLIIEVHELKSVKSLFSQNLILLARKIVERSAETGEHYITRTKEEYAAMFKAALGGGLVASFVVYIKLGILEWHAPGFIEGFFVSLAYSIGFLCIHFFGFTLGTKQAAMTAPAIAQKMQNLETEHGLKSLISEMTHLIRSQVASVLGNITAVIPLTLLFHLLFRSLFKEPILNPQSLQHTYHSSDIFGPSILYATFTGFLLWASSVAAGWGDNWFAYHALRKTLARSPSLLFLFGKMGARNLSVFLQKHFSAIIGNVSLGFLLGLTPSIFKFLSLPLDIRHVTISAGNLGVALPYWGLNFFKEADFWRSFLGVLLIGAINVLSSFSLAFIVALKAKNIDAPRRSALKKAILKRFATAPLSFFLPLEKTSEDSIPLPKED